MGGPIRLLLNDREVEFDVAAGMPVLDVVRDQLGLKGTKHACREGDCGACLVLLGELLPSCCLSYRALTSCLLPLAGGGPAGHGRGSPARPRTGATSDRDEGASQCGFCTPGSWSR
jgi:xanthine dehydrogenase small subunit